MGRLVQRLFPPPPPHIFWSSLVFSDPNKQHTIFLSTLTTFKIVALKARGLCENGRKVNVTIRGQTGLGHLHRLRARLLLSSISWRTPADALALRPIISGYLDDLWLQCHFHSAGLIAPNGGRFGGDRWDRQCMLATRSQPLTVI